MKDLMGLITLTEDERYLESITRIRPIASIPFGGRYRLIDFILSNLVNAGVLNVGIIFQNKHRSLIHHLGSGKEWDLHRKHEGLFIMTTDYTTHTPPHLQTGDLEALYSHLDYLHYSKQKYVLLSHSNMICNIDLSEVMHFHQEKKAHITMIYYRGEPSYSQSYASTYLKVDEEERIRGLEVSPPHPRYRNTSMKMYLLEKSLLIDLINRCFSRGGTDLVRDGFARRIKDLRFYGYHHKGYVAHISSLKSYFYHSMDLLKEEVWKELFFENGLIYTKSKDDPSTRYMEECEVNNALLSRGSVIHGSIENSIVFRRVKVERGASIKNSIIMSNCHIGEGAKLTNVILDKHIQVSPSQRLSGSSSYPIYIEKKSII